MSLAGKRIVITGGAGVLGQGVAQAAQSQGADVVLLDVVADDPRGGLQVDVLGKGVYASTQTEAFVVPEAQPVRILFAVDQSGSMSDQATALGSAF